MIELVFDLDPHMRAARLEGAVARLDHVALDVDDVSVVAQRLAALGARMDARGIVQVDSRLNTWSEPSSTLGVRLQLTAETTHP